jgi:bacillithiol biosynthesis cysteine-adding enzyme BshC
MTLAAGPGIFEAYVSGAAHAFFEGHYANPADRCRAVRRAVRPLAPAVADALAVQNGRLAASEARAAHLAALRRGAAAVVTGQQVGLFLGPLYTIYKAASAVRVARALAAESGQPVVPVFWLQTEDHDLPEIAACHVQSARDLPLTLRLPASPDERIAITHCTLPADITTCIQQLHDALANLPYAEPHLTHVARYYHAGAGWADAFAGLLAELFAPEGLVLINPRDPALGHAAAPIHRRALTAAEEIAAALMARGQALHAAGLAPAVHVRAGAPLSFFHPDGPAGRRVRLAPAEGGFAEVGGTRLHSRETLLAALAADPLRFSTSALLRPILQDSLLPTAAYVGGPGEVAYFAQLAPLYAAYDLPMPLFVPRARFRILEEKTLRLLARLHLEPDDAARAEDELLAARRATDPTSVDPSTLSITLLAPFDVALQGVRTRIEPAGPGLTAAIEKTRATVKMAVSKLVGKYEKALLHQDQGLVDDVHRVKQLLYPQDVPQERFYGLPYFAARYGERVFVERVLAAVDPFDPRPQDLTWPGSDAPRATTSAEEVLP